VVDPSNIGRAAARRDGAANHSRVTAGMPNELLLFLIVLI